MKHIVIINHNAGSPEHGPNFRSYFSAKGWTEKGYRVTIVCSSFSHKLKKIPKATKEYNLEMIDGIKYIWIKTSKYHNNIGRLFNYIQFLRKLKNLKLIITNNVDYVICSSPPPIWIFFAKSFSKYKRAKLIFEARDLWPDVVLETSRFSFLNPFVWFMMVAERVAYNNSDHVVSVNKNAFSVMAKRGLSFSRFTAIQNGIAMDSVIDKSENRNQIKLINSLKKDGWLVVGYSGSLTKVYCIKYLVEAAKSLKNQKIAFVIAGMGPLENELSKVSKELENFILVGWISKKTLPHFLSKVDICFAGLLDIPSFIYGSDSTKLYEYMRAKKPILHTISKNKSIVKESGCGIQVQSECSESIVKALLTFKSKTRSELGQMGEKGYQFLLKNNTFEVTNMKWINLFKSLGN